MGELIHPRLQLGIGRSAIGIADGLTVRDLPATGVVAGDLDQRLPELLSSLLAGGPAEEGS